jgi:hypothetical protein
VGKALGLFDRALIRALRDTVERECSLLPELNLPRKWIFLAHSFLRE